MRCACVCAYANPHKELTHCRIGGRRLEADGTGQKEKVRLLGRSCHMGVMERMKCAGVQRRSSTAQPPSPEYQDGGPTLDQGRSCELSLSRRRVVDLGAHGSHRTKNIVTLYVVVSRSSGGS